MNMSVLEYAFYAYVAIVALAFLGLTALALRRARTEKLDNDSSSKAAPRCLVIAPCKGQDIGLLDNLSSLKSQSYGNFEVIAVVDSNEDEALDQINASGIAHMVSDVSSRGSGKVRAIASAIMHNPDFEVYVVADSDVRFTNYWLEKLVSPFSDKSVGVSTAYPLFKPLGGFWSKVKMVWGFVGNGLMESEISRFSWGGSMAFRRSLLPDMDSVKKFSESLSDDIAITKLAKSSHLRIAYVPDTGIFVQCSENFGSFAEWANRQTALTLLGYRRNFYYGMLFYGSWILVFLSAIALTAFYSAFSAVLFLPAILGIAKTYGRAHTSDPAIGLISLFINFVYIANLIKARSMKSITWRGSSYQLEQQPAQK